MRLRPVSLSLALAMAAALALPVTAQAHRAWILPAATHLAGEQAWVTLDAAISNDIFHTDYHAMSLDGVTVTGPDGQPLELLNAHRGRHRSTFDLNLTDNGSYRVSSVSSGWVIAFWEENGEAQRWRGGADDLQAAIPPQAENVRVNEQHRRLETFITLGQPSDEVLAVSGEGLELQADTHPNDLFAGESAVFTLLIDGEPAADVDVEVIPDGMRYRDQQQMQTLTTDKAGRFQVTWPRAGMYWLSASYSDDKASLPGASRRASYTVTLEVLPL